MSRLSDNDRNWGPFTLGTWFKQLGLYFETGGESGTNSLMLTGFKRALRVRLPRIAKTYGLCYGFTLSSEGNGYDYLSVKYGPNGSWDSSKDKCWGYFLPWKMWKHVRTSIYTPSGEHFFTETPRQWREYYEQKEACPKAYFEFIDEADGTRVVASCITEEREWHRGEKWCSWLKWIYPKKIHRSLWMEFNTEIGSEKGSWKGGTIGAGIDMTEDDTPQSAFLRFCEKGLDHRGRTTGLKYLGTCGPPPPKPVAEETRDAQSA